MKERPLWTESMWLIMSLILLIVLVVLALRPTLITIGNLMGQIKKQKEISVQLDAKIAQVQQAISTMNSVADKMYLIDDALPIKPNWNIMMDSIAVIATASGGASESATATSGAFMVNNIFIDKIPLKINEIVIKSGQQYKPLVPEGVIPVRFTIMGKGEYTQMRQIVARLEKMRRILMLSSVSVDTNKKDGSLELTVIGEAGYYPKQDL